jgi:hypothetical protein
VGVYGCASPSGDEVVPRLLLVFFFVRRFTDSAVALVAACAVAARILDVPTTERKVTICTGRRRNGVAFESNPQ